VKLYNLTSKSNNNLNYFLFSANTSF